MGDPRLDAWAGGRRRPLRRRTAVADGEGIVHAQRVVVPMPDRERPQGLWERTASPWSTSPAGEMADSVADGVGPCSARVIRDQEHRFGCPWHIRARAGQRPPSAAAEGVEDGLEPQPPVLQTDRRSSGPGRQVPIGPAASARVSGPRVGWSEAGLPARAVPVQFLPHPCRTYSTPIGRRPSVA